MLGDLDTIAAIATAKGHGALSVVRISGGKTSEILRQCFVSKSFNPSESHKVSYGFWKSPKSADYLDEVVLLNYAGGKGFTGESACEIICHGGPIVTELVLEAALNAGARMARPGEFSYRAVINGKMDLAQAENILEIISARSPKRAAQAIKNITGSFSRAIKEMDQELIYMLAHLEAAIDFTTEDIQPVDFSEISKRAKKLREKIQDAIIFYKDNQKFQNGARVVIAGRPNAGKSSLLNALVGKDRSIVTEIAGTTRDTIEAESFIDGLMVRYVDTAGIRQSGDAIEKLGIEKTQVELKSADVVIYLIDAAEGLTESDVEQMKELSKETTIVGFNKIDLLEGRKFSTDLLDLSPWKTVNISCSQQSGLNELKRLVGKILSASTDSETEIFIASQRQEEALSICAQNLGRAIELLDKNESPDLVSFELKNALSSIKQVLGEEMNDEIMDKVFKEFCIGK